MPNLSKKVENQQKKDDIAPDLTSIDFVVVPVTERTKDFIHQQIYCEAFVSPLYKAEVPVWTGMFSGNDSKWLGTRMWSP